MASTKERGDDMNAIRSFEARLDVSRYVDLPGPLSTAVTVHAPEDVPPSPVIVFAFPGGGYSRGYYDVQRPELDGPSQAAFHASRGVVVVAADHLGVGESTIGDLDTLTMPVLAAGNHGTVVESLAALAQGALVPELAPITPSVVIGMGQSMGGCLGVVQQANHRSFDALAVLGYSGARMSLPVPPPGTDLIRYAFHWDEEPDSLVDADAGGEPQPWRSATMPGCVPAMAGSGLIVDEAAALDVPLFLAAGERDVIEDLYGEPDAFRSSPDITLYLLRRAAHMHNFAPTRTLLWDRLQRWFGALRPDPG
jgi:hypothetical protein